MSSAEPARHALYSRLEDVLGSDHARTLMTHLPQQTSDDVATKGDVSMLRAEMDARFDQMEARFDRMEARFDRMEAKFDRMEQRLTSQQRFYVATTFGTLTAMTAIFSIVVSLIT